MLTSSTRLARTVAPPAKTFLEPDDTER